MAFWGIAEALIETAELLQMPNILEDLSQARLEQVIAVNPHSGKALKGKLKGLNSYRVKIAFSLTLSAINRRRFLRDKNP